MTPAEIANSSATDEAVLLCANLSPRLREALVLTCKGLRPEAVAAALKVSRGTVHEMRSRIMDRLGVATMEEAAVMACKAGLV